MTGHAVITLRLALAAVVLSGVVWWLFRAEEARRVPQPPQATVRSEDGGSATVDARPLIVVSSTPATRPSSVPAAVAEPARGSVSVLIQMLDGQPVIGARVTCPQAADSNQETGADGLARFPGLLGAVTIKAEADGLFVEAPEPVTVAPDQAMRVVLTAVSPATVAVLVTTDGSPVEGADVVVVPDAASTRTGRAHEIAEDVPQWRATTDSNGQALVTAAPCVAYVHAFAKGHSFHAESVRTFVGGRSEVEVRGVRAVEVECLVVDRDTSLPVPGCAVACDAGRVQRRPGEPTAQSTRPVHTDESGVCWVTLVPGRTAVLRAVTSGMYGRMKLEPDPPRRIVFPVDVARDVAFWVTAPDGSAVLSGDFETTRDVSVAIKREASISDNGVHTLREVLVRHSSVMLRFVARGVGASAWVTISELSALSQSGPIPLPLQAMRAIHVRVVDPDGQPVPEARVDVAWSTRPYFPEVEAAMLATRETVTCDAGGIAWIEVANGINCWLTASLHGVGYATGTVAGAAPDGTTCTLTLAATRDVDLAVSIDGSPAAGQLIWVSLLDPPARRSVIRRTVSRGDGTAHFHGIPLGEYIVVSSGPDFAGIQTAPAPFLAPRVTITSDGPSTYPVELRVR